MILSRLLRRRGDTGWRDVPDDPIVARLRTAAGSGVPDAGMRVARSRSLALAEFAASAERQRPRTAAPSAPTSSRRFAYATVAATLVLALTAGGIAASGPGLPAYPLRLAVEELLLPAGSDARLGAQVDRLERRLDETADAAGNGVATGAALEAYERIATQLAATVRPDEPIDDAVTARISAQVRQLERMQATAAAGSGEALRSAHRLLLRLGAAQPDEPDPGPADPAVTHSPEPSPRRSPAQRPAPLPTSAPAPSAGASDRDGESPSTAPAGPSASPGDNGARPSERPHRLQSGPG